jgi:hypothetical protein
LILLKAVGITVGDNIHVIIYYYVLSPRPSEDDSINVESIWSIRYTGKDGADTGIVYAYQ